MDAVGRAGVARAPTLRAVAVLAAVQAATFHAGAPEMWLWQAALGALVVGLAPGVRGASVTPTRRRAAGIAAALWGLAGAAVVGLPAVELAREWTDPSAPVAGLLEWSMSWQQLVSIAVPDADFPRAEPFFGADQRFFFTLLLGPTAAWLAVAGGVRRRSRALWWLGGLCLLLALGQHFGLARLLLQLPPLRLFRFPVKYAVGALFAIAMLAAFGVDRLRVVARRRPAALREVGAALIGVGLGLLLSSRLLAGVREGLVEGAPWVAVSALVGAALAQTPLRSAGLAAWLGVELLAMPRRVWPPVEAAALLAPSPIAATIRGEPHGRVSIRVDVDDPGTPWCEAPDDDAAADRVVLESRRRLSVLRFLEEGLASTSGYGFRDPWRLARAFSQGPAAFQLAGVTHYVRNAGEPLRFEGPVPSRTAIDDLWLWRAPDAFPRGWAVHRVAVMSDDDAFAELARHPRAPADFAPLDGPAEVGPPPAGCRSTVETTETGPEHVTQDVALCAPGVVVLADAWFPGWAVSVDGAPATPRRAWGFLRAVAVPAGAHRVVWRYRPASFALGAGVSLAAWLAFALAWVWPVRRKSLK